MTGHKIIRNSDGSAYVVDRTGKHVATHDSAGDAQEHLKQLRNELDAHEKWDKGEHTLLSNALTKHIRKDETMHKKLEERLSHDPYYGKK
jgi:hypothetical protein